MLGTLKQWIRLVFDMGEEDRPTLATPLCQPESTAEESHPASRRDQARWSPKDLSWLSRYSTILELEPSALPHTLSPSVRLIALQATHELLRELALARSRGMSLRSYLQNRARKLRAVHDAAVKELLTPVAEQERQVRTLAWALDAPRPHCRRVRVIFAAHDGHDRSVPVRIQQYPEAASALYWWADSRPVPNWLSRLVDDTSAILLIDQDVKPDSTSLRHLTDINPALIERHESEGTTMQCVLSGAAGYIQALLRAPSARAWIRIRPPAGFCRLRHDILLPSMRALAARGEVATVRADGSSEEIVRSLMFCPKSAITDRLTYEGETIR